MLKFFKISLAFLFLFCFLYQWPAAAAFDENTKFCIKTQPLLLADIQKSILNPPEKDPNCEILATTLTAKEKESFLNTMCKDHGSSLKDEHYFLKLHNGDLTGRGSHLEICSGKRNPLLAWLPYAVIQQNYVQYLNPKERLTYIAKATDVEREKTELCHFRHSDLVNNISADLFTCVVMIFEDNFYGFDSNINVLVEIQPIMYEIRNITYLPWANLTDSYKTMLGEATLKNPSHDRKQCFGSVKYAFVEKVEVNVSSIYNANMSKIPLLYEHRGAVLELNDYGEGGIDVKEKAYFGRTMDPKSSVHVNVIGQWAEQRRQFNADVYEYFGYGIKRFHHEMRNGAAAFIRIQNTEPVYETIESTHTANATLHTVGGGSDNRRKSERLTEGGSKLAIDVDVRDSDWQEDEERLENPTGHPYPGFYPWFIAGCLIVGVTLLAAIIGMVHAYSKVKRQGDKNDYKIAGQC